MRRGRVLAESTRPRLLIEAGLPTRYALPHEPGVCWTPEPGGEALDDLVWTYEDPRPEVRAIAGLPALVDERVDVVVDAEAKKRPVMPWSPRRAAPGAA